MTEMKTVAREDPVDISDGTETTPILCKGNNICSTTLLQSFKYTKTNIPGNDFNADEFEEQFAGCSCQEYCTVELCPCLQCFGLAYEADGKISGKIFTEESPRPVLECGGACSCHRVKCGNRVVQNGIQYRLSVFHTPRKGYGLKIANDSGVYVSCGSFVCEYAGEVVGYDEAKKRIKYTESTGQDNYLIALREHVDGKKSCTYIDPRLIGNVGRFINHSCDPNLIMVPVRVNHHIPRLALFARRDIWAGEELTFDYSGQTTWNSHSHYEIDQEPSIDHEQNCSSNIKDSIQTEASTFPTPKGIQKREVSDCERSFSHKKARVSAENLHLKKINLKQTEHSPTSDTENSNLCERSAVPVFNKRDMNPEFQYVNRKTGAAAADTSIVDLSHSLNSESSSVCDRAVSVTIDNSTKAISDRINMQNIPYAETGSGTVGNDTRHSRKLCHCNSSNCSGYLPFDSTLLNDQ